MSAPPVIEPPRRVVSLVPSLTESLFDLDLGDRLVALSDACTRPAERLGGLPRVGGTKTPDVARIIALRPDLVLLNDEESRREDAEALATAGIPLWVTGPRSVLEAVGLLWQIMDVFDHPLMIPRVREIERAYDYTLAAARASAPVPTASCRSARSRPAWPTGSSPKCWRAWPRATRSSPRWNAKASRPARRM